MYLSSWFYTKIFGNLLASDEYGNKYYTNRKKTKRWVKFHKIDETSKVPQLWHAWLHEIIDYVPKDMKKFDWQGEHIPNTTGTGHFDHEKKTKSGFNFWQP